MTNPTSTFIEAQNLVRPLMMKDLRIEARSRGVSPAGGMEELRTRIIDQMISTNKFQLQGATSQATTTQSNVNQNNYSRPGGQQNVGNFITDRNTSRVLAPPGGRDGVFLGDYQPSPVKQAPRQQAVQPQASVQAQPKAAPQSTEQMGGGVSGIGQPGHGSSHNNNYSRPGGQQNVGNFITDRTSSKVLAPPGGRSNIMLG